MVRRHRLNGNGTTIEFVVKANLLNKIWTTRMVVDTFLQVILAPMLFKKACFYGKMALQHEALNQVYSIVIAN